MPAAVGARRRVESDVARLTDASEPETQGQLSTPWRLSRRDGLIAGVLVAAIAAGAAGWWNQYRPKEEVQQPTAVTVPAPAAQPQTATAPAPAPEKAEAHPPANVTVPAPAAQPQTATAPAPENEGRHAPANVTAPAPAAQPQTATAPAPAPEKEESHAPANVGPLTATQERALKTGDAFKECTDCPEMIVVPAGRFLMGSPAGQGDNFEHPQHEVTIAKPFAVLSSS
jgi:formylglycine-generating enzyme required for sulfatase activity